MLIRVGSAGAMQDYIKVRDIILATTASSISTPSKSIFKELNFAPSADFELLSEAFKYATKNGKKVHVGGIYSSDTFYDERPDLNKEMERHGILAVEMEAAELYTVALRYGCRALAILTISDHLLSGEKLSSKQRERSFGDMIEIALNAAF